MSPRAMAVASLVLIAGTPLAIHFEIPAPLLIAAFVLHGTAGWFLLPLDFYRRAFKGGATITDTFAICALLASLMIAVALAILAIA